MTASDALARFAEEVRGLAGRGELPLYPAFKTLLETIYPSPQEVESLLRAPEAGFPDFTVLSSSGRVLNWIEVKAPVVEIDPLPGPDRLRFERYRTSLPHVALTNGWKWILFVDGNETHRVEVSREWLTGAADLPAAERGALEKFFTTISSLSPTVARTYEDAVTLLANAARLIEAAVLDVAPAELPGPLEEARGSLKELVQTNPSDPSDISVEEFADVLAQMCTFGYLLARVEQGSDIDPTTAIEALNTVEHPFLKATLYAVVAPEPELEEVLQGVLRTACDAVNGAASQLAGPAGNWERVPYVYEKFFVKYKPEDQFKFGVFYTPPEITRFQAREVRRRLVEDFGLQGLTDPKARFLDPACGTGTYLLALAEEALNEAHELGQPVASTLEELFRDRVVGFDVSPGPAAVAQARLTAWLRSKGVEFESRFPVYTVNTLAPPHTGSVTVSANLWLENISREQEAGDAVKRDTPVLVVLGNPPWGDRPRETFQVGPGSADNLIGDWARNVGAAVINLYDLYVAFWRFAASLLLERPGVQEPRGVISYITNRSWLRGRAYRGMRSWLREHRASGHIVDLGGDIRAGARADDQPVFAIMAGSAISTIVFGGDGPETVAFQRLRGTRKEKLLTLVDEDLPAAGNVEGAGGDPFGPVDWGPLGSAPPITAYFRQNFPGVKTHRDELVIDVTREGLFRKMSEWNSLQGREREEKFRQSRDRQVTVDIAEPADPDDPSTGYEVRGQYILTHRYRPLDDRYLYGDTRFIDQPGRLWKYFETGGRVPALVTMDTRTRQGPVVLATDSLPGYDSFRGSYGTHVFPLIPARSETDSLVQAIDVLTDRAASWANEFGGGAREVGMYLLALGSAPSYSETFLEAMETEIVRFPATSDRDIFARAAELGAKLLAAWTLAVLPLGSWAQSSTGHALGDAKILGGEVGFENGDRLTGVHRQTPDFEISGYPVMERFLQARAHLPLTVELGEDIRRVAGAIAVLLDTRDESDALLEAAIAGPQASWASD